LLASGLSVPDELRITVVCHNLERDDIARTLSPETGRVIRFLELKDGEPSPAGPFMFGIANATAEYVSIMGSDDTVEPGAMGAWLALARRFRVTALIPPEVHASGIKVATPPTRPWRSRRLRPVRDRLVYRTAPLGLIKREAIGRLGLTMPSRLRSGSDQLFGLKLWFSGEEIAYGRRSPHYVVGADAATRVTTVPRPAEQELQAVIELIGDPWFTGLTLRSRRSVVTKLVRVHVFSAAAVRSERSSWTEDDRAVLSDLVVRFFAVAPGFERALSLADRRLMDAISARVTASQAIAALAQARRRFGRPSTLLTRDIRGILAVDGPLRFMVASFLL
jgi:hypothetical protein